VDEQRSATEAVAAEAQPPAGLIEPCERVWALDGVEQRVGVLCVEPVEEGRSVIGAVVELR